MVLSLPMATSSAEAVNTAFAQQILQKKLKFCGHNILHDNISVNASGIAAVKR
jgi:hypothetical protein